MKGNQEIEEEYISDQFDQEDGYDMEGQAANEAAVAIANQKHSSVDKEVEQVIKKNEDTNPKQGYLLPMDDDDSDQGGEDMDQIVDVEAEDEDEDDEGQDEDENEDMGEEDENDEEIINDDQDDNEEIEKQIVNITN